ncbi:MAG: methyl-accepting chemotaxis protein [Clostridia bacterium]|jgi:methyl-accepting chemotaxis protein|nr:methyl-accepting chemotaxis protein [Clostridiales bacterium]
MKSLKTRILVPILMLAVLGLGAVAGAGYFIASDALLSSIEETANMKVEKIIEITEGKLSMWKSEIELLAATKEAVELDVDGFLQRLKGCNDTLDEFHAIWIADSNDGIYHANDGRYASVSGKDYFTGALAGKTVVSEPTISTKTGKPIITVTAPVVDESGMAVGVVGGTIELAYVTDMINEEKLGESGYAIMMEQSGKYVAHPDEFSVLFGNMLEEDDANLVSLAERIMEGEGGIEYYSLEGDQKIAAYGRVTSTGWLVMMTTSKKEVMASLDMMKTISLASVAVAIVLTCVLINIIVGRTVKPIKEMAKITREVAGGNLRVEVDVKSKDEVGVLAQNFNAMIENMKALLKETKDMSATVASASQEMMASSQEASKVTEQVANTISELAKGASEQAEETQKVSDMVLQAVEATDQLSADIEYSEELTGRVKGTVDEGVKAVEYQKIKMEENKNAAQNVGTEIYDLAQRSERIGQIVNVIEDIADQTNLLALNAAIEAARAGEQGRGFAVVAEEVRKLAEDSMNATGDIGNLIKEIQAGIQRSVEEVKSTEAIVEAQENAVIQTTEAFEEILKATDELASRMKEVAEAARILNSNSVSMGDTTRNMASIIEESAAGTEEVASATEEQTAAIEQIASSSEHLADLANKLQSAIERFTI